jgi:3'(2'), 5'-bisphosphate nucleotidase
MNTFIKDAIDAALLAKVEILKIYQSNFSYTSKNDDSPVTQADQIADLIIRTYLQKKYPMFGFLTEESSDDFSRLTKEYVWVVDPIDGTKDFIAKNDEFTINIALIHHHQVVAGIVMIPACDEVYYAMKGEGAYFLKDGVSKRIYVNQKVQDLTVLTSRFHVQPAELALIEKYKSMITQVETFGSALKACRIASGLAEISYRLSSGTKEWDTASSDLIVTEAGGLFIKPRLPIETYTYNREEVKNIDGYVILNRIENLYL